jgi:hypothetical protein
LFNFSPFSCLYPIKTRTQIAANSRRSRATKLAYLERLLTPPPPSPALSAAAATLATATANAKMCANWQKRLLSTFSVANPPSFPYNPAADADADADADVEMTHKELAELSG